MPAELISRQRQARQPASRRPRYLIASILPACAFPPARGDERRRNVKVRRDRFASQQLPGGACCSHARLCQYLASLAAFAALRRPEVSSAASAVMPGTPVVQLCQVEWCHGTHSQERCHLRLMSASMRVVKRGNRDGFSSRILGLTALFALHRNVQGWMCVGFEPLSWFWSRLTVVLAIIQATWYPLHVET